MVFVLSYNKRILFSLALQIGAMDEDVGKMLLKYPWVLSTSIQENYKEILLFFDEEKVLYPFS